MQTGLEGLSLATDDKRVLLLRGPRARSLSRGFAIGCPGAWHLVLSLLAVLGRAKQGTGPLRIVVGRVAAFPASRRLRLIIRTGSVARHLAKIVEVAILFHAVLLLAALVLPGPSSFLFTTTDSICALRRSGSSSRSSLTDLHSIEIAGQVGYIDRRFMLLLDVLNNGAWRPSGGQRGLRLLANCVDILL